MCGIDYTQVPKNPLPQEHLRNLRMVFLTWDQSGTRRMQIAPINYKDFLVGAHLLPSKKQ